MSTILDALRKLQRERSAQSPAKDLRGSITHEAAPGRARRRSGGSRGIAALLALLAVGGGGYLLYKSGQVQALIARFQPADDDGLPSDEELAVMVREETERDAAAARQQAPAQAETSPPASQPEATQRARPPQQPSRVAAPPSTGVPHSPENPDMAAERARLEAALANARAAQEAQRQAELDASAQPAVPQPAQDTEVVAETPPAPAAAPPPAKLVVAKRKPPTAAKPAEPVATEKPAAPVAKAKPKPAPKAEAPASRPPAEDAAESAPLSTAFPDVRVESIRWHPIPERRVASLRFERQNAPEAREGDIVGGVLVYRINPGSVELRVGSAQRTIAPGP